MGACKCGGGGLWKGSKTFERHGPFERGQNLHCRGAGSGPWRMIKTTFLTLALPCPPTPPHTHTALSLNGGSCPGVGWNGWESFPSIGNGEAAVPSAPPGWGLGLPDSPNPSWGGSDQRECIWEHPTPPPNSIPTLQLSWGHSRRRRYPHLHHQGRGFRRWARMRGGDQSLNKCAPKGHWWVARREEGRA